MVKPTVENSPNELSVLTCAQVLNFRHGEGDFPWADAGSALLDVNEALLVAIDERSQEHAAYQAEDSGVGADAQRQREHHGGCQSFAARQGPHSKSQVFHEGQDGFTRSRIFRLTLAHDSYSFASLPRRIPDAANSGSSPLPSLPGRGRLGRLTL